MLYQGSFAAGYRTHVISDELCRIIVEEFLTNICNRFVFKNDIEQFLQRVIHLT